ncbi:MAG: hypothetical protein M1834_006216 [Cirrosporium novae-zelandiae]|nr:MAG: hypothetical protein M1834_006216 [Cirrosporium novae-zelandiae]
MRLYEVYKQPDGFLKYLAIAANLHVFIRQLLVTDPDIILDEDNPCLLQMATFGPKLFADDQDRIEMIQSLVHSSYPIDLRAGPIKPVPGFDNLVKMENVTLQLGSAPLKVSTSFLLALGEVHNMTNDLRLQLLEIFLSLGANLDTCLSISLSGNVAYPIKLFCARYGRMDVIKLILKYQGYRDDNLLESPLYRIAVLSQAVGLNGDFFGRLEGAWRFLRRTWGCLYELKPFSLTTMEDIEDLELDPPLGTVTALQVIGRIAGSVALPFFGAESSLPLPDRTRTVLLGLEGFEHSDHSSMYSDYDLRYQMIISNQEGDHLSFTSGTSGPRKRGGLQAPSSGSTILELSHVCGRDGEGDGRKEGRKQGADF